VRRPWLLLVVVLLAAAAAGVALAFRRVEAGGSTLSRGAGGWLAARAYLEAAGSPTRLLDGPLAEAPAGGVLVLVFPWQSRRGDVDLDAVRAHLERGGALVLAYANEIAPSAAEVMLLQALGAVVDPVRAAPVAPWEWRSASRAWALRPPARWRGPDGELLLRRPRWVPQPPPGSALLKGPDGHAVMAAWRLGGGRVVVLPAELLCNARLREPAHAALLESLRRALPGEWTFDEMHHGLARPGVPLPGGGGLGFDLLLGQLLLLYAVAALALARRLGPAWRETPPLVGNAAAFLLRLGRLHHRLGHHRDGAAILLARAAELDRRFVPPADLSRLAGRGDADALVEVARRVAGHDRDRRRRGSDRR
jgi:hypothetical protein